MGAPTGCRRPRALAAALLLLAAVLLPAASSPDARAATCTSAPTGGMDFLPSTTSMHVTADNVYASSLVDLGTVSITLADCTTRSVQHYQFQQLSLGNLGIGSNAGTGAYSLSVTTGSGVTSVLGGTTPTGTVMYTDFWGSIDNLYLSPLCLINVAGLIGPISSLISLSAGGFCFQATVYGIKAYDNSGSTGTTDNPVNIPGTLSVVSQ